MSIDENMTTINEVFVSLADGYRKSTGLADKLSLTDMTELMKTASFFNLLPNTSEQWKNSVSQYGNDSIRIPLKMGESIAYSYEFKMGVENKHLPGIMMVLYDKDGHMLNPWEISNGVRPTTDSPGTAGFWMDMKSNEAGTLRYGTYTADAKNVAAIQLSIANGSPEIFQYRKAMLTYGRYNLPWTPNHKN